MVCLVFKTCDSVVSLHYLTEHCKVSHQPSIEVSEDSLESLFDYVAGCVFSGCVILVHLQVAAGLDAGK